MIASLFGTPASFAKEFKANPIKAVVTVLEAPLFSRRSFSAPVKEWLRKGDEITLHPFYRRREQYRELRENDFKFEDYQKQFPDAFLSSDEQTFEDDLLDPRFYLTLDARGKKAFVSKEHVYVFFETPQEFAQSPQGFRNDRSDYRIQEPLVPKSYPFVSGEKEQSYMGQLLIGSGQASTTNYPYQAEALQEQKDPKIHFQLAWHKAFENSVKGKWLWGGVLSVESWQQRYDVADNTQRRTTESWFELNVGPSLYFNPILKNKYRVGFIGQLHFPLVMRNEVAQTNLSGVGDIREFNGFMPTIHLGPIFEIVGAIGTLDFVIAPLLKIRPPHSMQTNEAAVNPTFWEGDEFDQPFSVDVNLTIGLQSRI